MIFTMANEGYAIGEEVAKRQLNKFENKIRKDERAKVLEAMENGSAYYQGNDILINGKSEVAPVMTRWDIEALIKKLR